MDFKLLISRKKNAEAYKEQIAALKDEITQIKSKKQLTMFLEEKKQYDQEIESKKKEIEKCQTKYDEKKALIEADIEKAKTEFEKQNEEIEGRKISKEKYEELVESKKEKEEELKEYLEIRIPELQEKINSVTSKATTMGYDFDIASLAKELENQVSYKTYLQEEISELDEKLKDTIVIEDNMQKLKYATYFKMRLVSLNYDNLENWYEKEQQLREEIEPQEPPVQQPSVQEPPVQESPAQEPPVQQSPVQQSLVQKPPVKKSPVQPHKGVDYNVFFSKEYKEKYGKPANETNISIDAETGMVYCNRTINGMQYKTNYSLDKIFENKKNIRKDLCRFLENFGEKKTLALIKRHHRKMNPAVLKVLLEEQEIELTEKYVEAVVNGDKSKLPFDEYTTNLEGNFSVTEKTFRELNRHALRDNKNLGTNFKATPWYTVKKFLTRIPGKKLLASKWIGKLPEPISEEKLSEEEKGFKIRPYREIKKDLRSDKSKFMESLKVFPKETLSKAYHYTSKKLNRSRLLNNIRMHGEIAGRKITGYVKRENPLKVKSDVNKIKEDYQSR